MALVVGYYEQRGQGGVQISPIIVKVAEVAYSCGDCIITGESYSFNGYGLPSDMFSGCLEIK